MFCPHCGNSIQPGSRFCPSCGKPLAFATAGSDASESSSTAGQTDPGKASQVPPVGDPAGSNWGARGGRQNSPPPFVPRQLVRPRSPRMIAGVCSGLALHFGWDLNLVRIFVALISLFYGIGVLAYFAAWIIIPEAPYSLPTSV